ncbi:MAG: hypothetical protein ACTSXX_14295 [Candidatus Baldrarchaeia archaeon]
MRAALPKGEVEVGGLMRVDITGAMTSEIVLEVPVVVGIEVNSSGTFVHVSETRMKMDVSELDLRFTLHHEGFSTEVIEPLNVTLYLPTLENISLYMESVESNITGDVLTNLTMAATSLEVVVGKEVVEVHVSVLNATVDTRFDMSGSMDASMKVTTRDTSVMSVNVSVVFSGTSVDLSLNASGVVKTAAYVGIEVADISVGVSGTTVVNVTKAEVDAWMKVAERQRVSVLMNETGTYIDVEEFEAEVEQRRLWVEGEVTVEEQVLRTEEGAELRVSMGAIELNGTAAIMSVTLNGSVVLSRKVGLMTPAISLVYDGRVEVGVEGDVNATVGLPRYLRAYIEVNATGIFLNVSEMEGRAVAVSMVAEEITVDVEGAVDIGVTGKVVTRVVEESRVLVVDGRADIEMSVDVALSVTGAVIDQVMVMSVGAEGVEVNITEVDVKLPVRVTEQVVDAVARFSGLRVMMTEPVHVGLPMGAVDLSGKVDVLLTGSMLLNATLLESVDLSVEMNKSGTFVSVSEGKVAVRVDATLSVSAIISQTVTVVEPIYVKSVTVAGKVQEITLESGVITTDSKVAVDITITGVNSTITFNASGTFVKALEAYTVSASVSEMSVSASTTTDVSAKVYSNETTVVELPKGAIRLEGELNVTSLTASLSTVASLVSVVTTKIEVNASGTFVSISAGKVEAEVTASVSVSAVMSQTIAILDAIYVKSVTVAGAVQEITLESGVINMNAKVTADLTVTGMNSTITFNASGTFVKALEAYTVSASVSEMSVSASTTTNVSAKVYSSETTVIELPKGAIRLEGELNVTSLTASLSTVMSLTSALSANIEVNASGTFVSVSESTIKLKAVVSVEMNASVAQKISVIEGVHARIVLPSGGVEDLKLEDGEVTVDASVALKFAVSKMESAVELNASGVFVEVLGTSLIEAEVKRADIGLSAQMLSVGLYSSERMILILPMSEIRTSGTVDVGLYANVSAAIALKSSLSVVQEVNSSGTFMRVGMVVLAVSASMEVEASVDMSQRVGLMDEVRVHLDLPSGGVQEVVVGSGEVKVTGSVDAFMEVDELSASAVLNESGAFVDVDSLVQRVRVTSASMEVETVTEMAMGMRGTERVVVGLATGEIHVGGEILIDASVRMRGSIAMTEVSEVAIEVNATGTFLDVERAAVEILADVNVTLRAEVAQRFRAEGVALALVIPSGSVALNVSSIELESEGVVGVGLGVAGLKVAVELNASGVFAEVEEEVEQVVEIEEMALNGSAVIDVEGSVETPLRVVTEESETVVAGIRKMALRGEFVQSIEVVNVTRVGVGLTEGEVAVEVVEGRIEVKVSEGAVVGEVGGLEGLNVTGSMEVPVGEEVRLEIEGARVYGEGVVLLTARIVDGEVVLEPSGMSVALGAATSLNMSVVGGVLVMENERLTVDGYLRQEGRNFTIYSDVYDVCEGLILGRNITMLLIDGAMGVKGTLKVEGVMLRMEGYAFVVNGSGVYIVELPAGSVGEMRGRLLDVDGETVMEGHVEVDTRVGGIVMKVPFVSDGRLRVEGVFRMGNMLRIEDEMLTEGYISLVGETVLRARIVIKGLNVINETIYYSKGLLELKDADARFTGSVTLGPGTSLAVKGAVVLITPVGEIKVPVPVRLTMVYDVSLFLLIVVMFLIVLRILWGVVSAIVRRVRRRPEVEERVREKLEEIRRREEAAELERMLEGIEEGAAPEVEEEAREEESVEKEIEEMAEEGLRGEEGAEEG